MRMPLWMRNGLARTDAAPALKADAPPKGRVYPQPFTKEELFRKWFVYRSRGLAVALALILLGLFSTYAETSSWAWTVPFQHLLHEFGMALMIAGVVGIGVEVYTLSVGKFKKEVEYDEHLKMLEVMAHGQVIRTEPFEVIQGALPLLFSGDKYHYIVRNLLQAISNMDEIRRLSEAKPTTEVRHIMSFLAWTTDCFVSDVAGQMARLISALHRHGDCLVCFTPPDRYVQYRHLLKAQIRSLSLGDRYDSLANVRLYNDDPNDEYIQATTFMIARKGVSVRRIFNLSGYDLAMPRSAECRHAQAVIGLQRASICVGNTGPFPDEDSDTPGTAGSVEFRYLTKEVLEASGENSEKLEKFHYALQQSGVSAENLQRTYFGAFYLGKKKVLLFEGDFNNQGALRVMAGEVTREDIVNRKRLFEALWEVCSTVSPFDAPPSARQAVGSPSGPSQHAPTVPAGVSTLPGEQSPQTSIGQTVAADGGFPSPTSSATASECFMIRDIKELDEFERVRKFVRDKLTPNEFALLCRHGCRLAEPEMPDK
ncbi:hypothetical protein B0G75_103565 [Paraburkholderia sp. BL18I3N2]|uniref:hypothetical protein n=1 Tax=Paraburkholderia sp. BL18I3N2 TaxID=1938799 RepID=UPI000D0811C8|nr:hypothetical protein [Paraburkholderia sp. BL18I3N2]PRX33337.1 hypothetical protein B0G75_103565 [Paraburkholderia sp. BL18I3N2]